MKSKPTGNVTFRKGGHFSVGGPSRAAARHSRGLFDAIQAANGLRRPADTFLELYDLRTSICRWSDSIVQVRT
jgi:hypothetical protein